MGITKRLAALVEMMKPTQLALLMVTMFGAYFAAGGDLNLHKIILLILTGIGSAGGVTALNMYIEHDIDSIMPRTSGRPLPRGDIKPSESILLIIIVISIGIISSSLINKWVLLTVLAGLYFDIIAYTELFKRHTPWALLAGSVAGSMPALGGWAAGCGCIDIAGLILAGTVYVWQPLHVSFIHYAYNEDYVSAGIPTLPGRVGLKGYGALSMVSILGLIGLTWAFAITAGFGYATAALVTIVGAGAARAAYRFLRRPDRSVARRIVKLASPTLGIVFVMLPIERYLLPTILGIIPG